MPILGLTDQQASFPRIGILRKGDKKPNDKQPGRDLDHFRFTSEDASVTATFEAAYGKEPRRVNVYLPFRTTDENFPCFQEAWVAGGLKHRCDGKTTILSQRDDGTYWHQPQPCPGGCKAVGRLSVVVPELGRLAFVTVLTSGINDVKNLTSELRGLEMGIHDLRGIPMIVSRVKGMVSSPEFYPKDHPKAGQRTGRRVRREKWLLHIEAAPSWVARQLASQQAGALKLLAGGVPEVEADGDDDNGVVFDGTTGEIVSTVQPGFAAETEPPEQDEEEAPEEAQALPPANPSGRPWNAERVRAFVREKADWDGDRRRMEGEPVATPQVGFIAGTLNKMLRHDGITQALLDHERYLILNWLLGITSTKDATKAEASALLTWLIDQENKTEPYPAAFAEVRSILQQAEQMAGQQKLI
jgi:hypothetical protein